MTADAKLRGGLAVARAGNGIVLWLVGGVNGGLTAMFSALVSEGKTLW